MHVRRHPDAASFLARAEAWLLQREAEYNLILGLARRLTASPEDDDPPIYLATVEDTGQIVGCAFRTPPFKLGLTRMPAAALPPLVADVAAVYDTLPAVLGPPEEAHRFGTLWAEQQAVHTRTGMQQRIYQLDALTPPDPWPPGQARFATAADTALVAAWFAAFNRDVGMPGHDPQQQAKASIARRGMLFWEHDGQPVSMAGTAAFTPHGARVGPVYTPPENRGHGYGTAATAALTRHLLAGGRRFCFLYTDLANPTSNRIYQRLGYAPVCDVVDVLFEPAS